MLNINAFLLLALLSAVKNYGNHWKIDTALKDKISTMSDESVPVIILSKSLNGSSIEQFIKEHKGKLKYRLPIINGYAVELRCNCLMPMANIKEVEYICEDSKISSFMDIARKTVGAHNFGNNKYTGSNVVVAILDTGVYPHPDLTKPKNRIIYFKDFVNNKKFPYDDNGHGTHVAGTVAGNGTMSKGKYNGIAPEAKIIGIKVLDSNGSGNASDILAGMQWVLDNKDKYNIRIVSLSLGSKPNKAATMDPLIRGVNALWDNNLVVVAAAGNSGPKRSTIASPGISPKIITVGASDDMRTIEPFDDSIADFSSRGPVGCCGKKPDLVAPGVNIVSTATDKKYGGDKNGPDGANMPKPYRTMSGTSVSTPIVSGCIALILEKYPSLTPNDIKKLLKKSTINLNKSEYVQGKGLISLKKLNGQ